MQEEEATTTLPPRTEPVDHAARGADPGTAPGEPTGSPEQPPAPARRRAAARPGPAAAAAPAARSRSLVRLAAMATIEDFDKLDIRVGRIVEVEDFPEARKPAWKLRVDFGEEIGVKRTSAQIKHYTREELEGRLVMGVVNFPPRQIGPVMSEVLVLGRARRGGPRDPAAALVRGAARRPDVLSVRRRASAR